MIIEQLFLGILTIFYVRIFVIIEYKSIQKCIFAESVFKFSYIYNRLDFLQMIYFLFQLISIKFNTKKIVDNMILIILLIKDKNVH